MIDWAKAYGISSVGEHLPLSKSVASPRYVLFFRDRHMADKRNTLTGYDASEGALYVLFAAVLAVHQAAPALLAIDNVDHGLNPRLARALVKGMSEWVLSGPENKQLLLTTHNPLVLDGLDIGNDQMRLFAVDRSRQGKTTIHRVRITKKILARARKGWTLSRMWVNGHIGGVPDV
jgi:predicted ATPase